VTALFFFESWVISFTTFSVFLPTHQQPPHVAVVAVVAVVAAVSLEQPGTSDNSRVERKQV
jgi:hypothetical protein